MGGGGVVGAGHALVSGASPRVRARQPTANAVPARPRSRRPREGVQAPQAQDAGLRGARGRSLPNSPDAHDRGVRDRPHGRPSPRPERGPRRGHRPRTRPGPSAVRAHRRGGARQRPAGSRRSRLPPQRALAPRGRLARARRPRAQPHRAGPRRDPQPHRFGPSGDARGADRPHRRSLRLHQPRHRRRAAGGDPRPGRPAGRGDRASRADGGTADRRPRHGSRRDLAPSRRHRAGRRRGAGDAAPARLHVRARLPGAGGPQRARAGAVDRAEPRRALSGEPGRGTGGERGRRRCAARDRLRRRDDRPLLHRHLQAPCAAGGVAPVSRDGGMFTADTVERVKEAADIVEIIQAHTDLRRSGTRFTGLCPFHDERSPSFSVDPQAKLYHCFGCGVGGDVIKFVEEKEGLAFPEAVESLADRYGVEVEREKSDPRAEEARRRRARLADALERTADFYSAFLRSSPKAGKAREYLEGRGLGAEVLEAFGVGFAPSAWDQVLTRGQQAGFSIAELEAAGLIQKGRKGGHYDRFRARITFPVRDPRGRVQGFGARALSPDSKPKYLNSPEGELYRKSRTLYGIERARAAIAKRGRAVVVEGYTDVLAAHQAGIEEAVAVMGTAITPEQLSILGSHTDEVVLALDADRAGRDAMLRSQRVAGSRRVRLRVAAMPAGEDPADMLSEGPVDRLRELIDDAVEMPVFHVRAILDAADLASPAGRDRALDEAVPVLAAMGETISRDELAREVGDRLDADPSLVNRRIAAPRPKPADDG